jgi:hypothetical protein
LVVLHLAGDGCMALHAQDCLVRFERLVAQVTLVFKIHVTVIAGQFNPRNVFGAHQSRRELDASLVPGDQSQNDDEHNRDDDADRRKQRGISGVGLAQLIPSSAGMAFQAARGIIGGF